MEPTILVVTEVNDPTADLVISELNDRRVPVARIDPGDFPHQLRLAATLAPTGLGGTITSVTRTVGLGSVRSVYWRRPSAYSAPEHLNDQEAEWVRDQSRWGLGGVLAALPGAFFVNHPWRNRDAESKPAQLATAAASGFTIPLTLITNYPGQARVFAAEQVSVVYKPLWPSPYQGEDGTERTIWVREVGSHTIDDSVSGAAHQFQVRVDKDADIRLTAVGERLFAVRIDGAPGLDWRTDHSRLAYTPVAVPEGIAKAVRTYLDAFGLVFGAFDFALRRDGQWVFLECNPNGQWAWFETPVSEQITVALADALEKGHT